MRIGRSVLPMSGSLLLQNIFQIFHEALGADYEDIRIEPIRTVTEYNGNRVNPSLQTLLFNTRLIDSMLSELP